MCEGWALWLSSWIFEKCSRLNRNTLCLSLSVNCWLFLFTVNTDDADLYYSVLIDELKGYLGKWKRHKKVNLRKFTMNPFSLKSTEDNVFFFFSIILYLAMPPVIIDFFEMFSYSWDCLDRKLSGMLMKNPCNLIHDYSLIPFFPLAITVYISSPLIRSYSATCF